MPIITSNPIERDGRSYDKLAISMAFSPQWRDDGVGVSVAMRAVPYAQDEQGIDHLDDDARAVVFGDVTQETDPATLQCLRDISAALQAFIDAKGL